MCLSTGRSGRSVCPMQTAKVGGGAELAFDDEGQGRPVVLVHAGIADRRMWGPVAAALAAAGHRAIRYDLRGYGDSTLPAEPFAHHDDLVALLDALRLDRAVLVGCSLGGAVAIDTTLAHPGRVAGLAAVNAAVSGRPWSAEFRRLWKASVGAAPEDDLDAVAEAEVRLWVVGPDRPLDALDPGLLDLARDMDRRALAAEARLEEIEERELDPPAAGRLAEIRVPTLVMAGAADLPDIRQIADELTAGVPDARRLPDVPDAAHLLPAERPDEVADALRAFLATIAW